MCSRRCRRRACRRRRRRSDIGVGCRIWVISDLTAAYFLRCLLRIMEKYIAAKAASSTPPNIRIKVVIICSPISTSKIKVARVQQPICSPKTRRSRCRLVPLRHRSLLTSRPVRSLPLWLTVLAITDLSFPGATLLTPRPLCCIQCGGATRIPAGRGNNPRSWCSV